MRLDDRPISTSLATVALEPDNGGTRLTYTEQGAFFDGLDGVASRQAGWTCLLGEMVQAMDATGAVQERRRRAGPQAAAARVWPPSPSARPAVATATGYTASVPTPGLSGPPEAASAPASDRE